MTRVAVLGAGFQGVCAALELAGRGVDVDLYDRQDACITQAGLHNEGKIHLGFVYANDPSFETSRLLARGAPVIAACSRTYRSPAESSSPPAKRTSTIHEADYTPARRSASARWINHPRNSQKTGTKQGRSS